MPGFEIIDEQEKEAVSNLFEEGGVLFAHGFDNLRKNFHVREFEKSISLHMGCQYAHAVSSGTAAIKCALRSLGVGPGDEVITQGFNFIATVEAIHDCGATTRICGIDHNLNIDIDDLKKKVTSKTKCVIAVNMLGIAGDLVELLKWCRENKIPVIEDACECVGGKTDAGYLGTLCDIGIFSFDHGKNLTCGEGGMILTSDENIYHFVRSYSDHGHELNTDVARGLDKALMPGFNYRMTEMQAVIGKVQLAKLERLVDNNKQRYTAIVDILMDKFKIRRTANPDGGQSFDTVIILDVGVEDKERILKVLSDARMGTKNLPDAMRWHCSYYWNHILEESEIKESIDIHKKLQSSIAIPILINRTVEDYRDIGKKLSSIVKI